MRKSLESPEIVLQSSYKVLRKSKGGPEEIPENLQSMSWESPQKSWKRPEKVLRKYWESSEQSLESPEKFLGQSEKVLIKFLKTSEKVLRKSWEILGKSWKSHVNVDLSNKHWPKINWKENYQKACTTNPLTPLSTCGKRFNFLWLSQVIYFIFGLPFQQNQKLQWCHFKVAFYAKF